MTCINHYAAALLLTLLLHELQHGLLVIACFLLAFAATIAAVLFLPKF